MKIVAWFYHNSGYNKISHGRHSMAIKPLLSSIEIKRKYCGQKSISETLKLLATAYTNINNHEKEALDYSYEYLGMVKQLGGKTEIALTLINIGCILTTLDQMEKATECFNEALVIIRDNGHYRYKMKVVCYAGEALIVKEKYQEGINFFKAGLDFKVSFGYEYYIARAFAGIGYAYQLQGQLEAALVYYQNGLNVKKTIGSGPYVAFINYKISEIYEISGDYVKALYYCNKADTQASFLRFFYYKDLAQKIKSKKQSLKDKTVNNIKVLTNKHPDR